MSMVLKTWLVRANKTSFLPFSKHTQNEVSTFLVMGYLKFSRMVSAFCALLKALIWQARMIFMYLPAKSDDLICAQAILFRGKFALPRKANVILLYLK